MKKCWLILLGLVFAFNCYAGNTESVTVKAGIPQVLELSHWIQQVPAGSTDPYGTGTSPVTSISFGDLVWDETNSIWVSDKYFATFLIGRTSGRPYIISQQNLGVSNGAGQDMNTSIVMTPDYQPADVLGAEAQGALPAGAVVGDKALSFGTKNVYASGTAGKSRIVRCYHGIATGDDTDPVGAEVVTGDKKAGEYAGTVTYTITLQ